MQKALLAIAILLSCSSLVAQTEAQCTRSLDEAEQAFEQGRLLFILDRTANAQFYSCLEAGRFSIEEEIRARKLLVKAYLFSDNEEEAEKALVELLKADKEHQLTAEDPAELYFLYSKFKTEPILRVSIKFGGNKTYVKRLQEFNTSQSVSKRYNPGFGSGLNIWAELLAERYFDYGLEVAAGTQIRVARYDIEGELIENVLTYQASNISTALRFPLLVRYNFGYDAKDDNDERKTMIPYVFFGGSFDWFIGARYEDTSRSGGTAVSLDDGASSLSELNQIANVNASIFGGAGLKFRVGRARVDFLNFEVRYDNSLFNYINPQNRWDNQNVAFEIGHVEDDLTINTVSVSVGYIRSLYKPRKRKQFRY